MSAHPDPKPAKRRHRNAPRRQIDRSASKRCLLEEPECVVCKQPATNADHLLRRGSPYFGDDDPSNMVSLCGSGSSRCHGARHGSAFVDGVGKRWTPEEVRRKIGLFVLARPSKLAYLREKLGSEERAVDFLVRTFGLKEEDFDGTR